jgi:hypothetical protein
MFETFQILGLFRYNTWLAVNRIRKEGNIIQYKSMHKLKLLLNVDTTGIDALAILGNKILYELLSESSQTVIAVIALVKEDERGGQGHTFASILHQSCETVL